MMLIDGAFSAMTGYVIIWDDPRKRGGERWIMVSPEDAAEARRCLPHIENEVARYILEKIANCYPAPEEPTLPMGEGE